MTIYNLGLNAKQILFAIVVVVVVVVVMVVFK